MEGSFKQQQKKFYMVAAVQLDMHLELRFLCNKKQTKGQQNTGANEQKHSTTATAHKEEGGVIQNPPLRAKNIKILDYVRLICVRGLMVLYIYI